MDKNIAAILRKDAKTIAVTFNGGTSKTYTYVTDIDFKAGDYAIVEVSGDFKVVEVVNTAPDLRIPPNSDIQFKWVVAKLDLTDYEKNKQRNAAIEDTVAQAYQHRMRSQFADQVLANLPEDVRNNLAPLLE